MGTLKQNPYEVVSNTHKISRISSSNIPTLLETMWAQGITHTHTMGLPTTKSLLV